jgi:uncharacterized protein (TIGR03067 family)
MRFDIALIVAASLIGVPDRPKKVDPVKQEKKKLDGTWRAVAVEHLGQNWQGGGFTMTFAVNNKYTQTASNGNVMEEGNYKIDPSKKLKSIDLEILTGKDKGKNQYCLYELQGDSLKMCLPIPGKDRPTEFTTKKGTGYEIFIMTRVKK